MKSMMRCVALMVALVMVLGWAEAIRPGVVAANEDVELLQPPPTKGDPDDGGPSRIFRLRVGSWLGSLGGSLRGGRGPTPVRATHSTPKVRSNLRQPWTRSR